MTVQTFSSHGVAIGVRTNDPALVDRVTECFPPGWEPAPASDVDAWYSLVQAPRADGRGTRYALYRGEEKLDEGFRLKRLLEELDSVLRRDVSRRAPERLFVHAGAVAWKGRCIVLPGLSGAGKTTLVAALVRAGALYCSDEYAVLDAAGLVHPYPRPLSFRQGGHRRIQRSASEAGGAGHAGQPLPLGLVVHTRYRAGTQWRAQEISAGESALSIFANVLVARDRPAFAFSILSSAMHHAKSLRGDRGEAAEAAAAILASADYLHALTEGTRL
jgi:hypothetical protein